MPENNALMNGEILIDINSVNVRLERYNELLKAEVMLDFIKKAYLADMASYRFEEMLKFIFGEKGEKKDAE